MSFTRPSWDTCAYDTKLGMSSGTLGYVLSPLPVANPHQCRHDLGLVGGAGVSHIKGNLVDLESDLRGQTRLLGCVQQQYFPQTDRFIRNMKTDPIDTSKQHLGSCQMFPFPSVPQPPPVNYSRCTQ